MRTGLFSALASVAVLVFCTASAGAAELRVDDDHAQCPTATFTTIQSAVNAAAASPGKDKIKVCPGDYQEQVRIEGHALDGLKLEALKPVKLKLDQAEDPTSESIIKFPATLAFTDTRALVLVRTATDVQVSGFRITGPYTFPGCAEALERTYGVRVDGGGELKLDHNRVTHIENSNPALRGCQNGIAVQVGRDFEEQVGTADIDHNLIDNYEKNGPTIDGAGSYAHIHENDIYGIGPTPVVAQNGIQVGRGASADVDHNLVADNVYNGPVNDAASGLILFDYGALDVDHNDVLRNDYGIYLDGQAAKVDHNKVSDSTYDGLYAESTSANNRIEENDISGSGLHDCHDSSNGGGTAGTANTWKGDKGKTQNRPGLCKGAAVVNDPNGG